MTIAAPVEEYERLAARIYARQVADRSPINVGALVDAAAARDPRRAAVRWGPAAERALTYGELSARSSRLASSFRRLGAEPGDRIAISLPQGPDAAVAHAAALKAGAISMPLSRLYGGRALAARLGSGRPRLVVCSEDAAERMAAALRDAGVHAVIVIAGHEADGSAPSELSRLIERGDESFRAVATGRDEPALLLYTSGTTGAPKGVLHAHRVVPGHAAGLGLAHNLYPRRDSVLWTPADWSWAGGLVNCLLYSWLTATTIVCAPDAPFDAEAALSLLEHAGVSAAFVPPTALRRMRRATSEPVRERLALTSIMTGSEPMDPDLVAWCVEYLGARPNEVYGQTEASAVVGNSMLLPARPGSVGRPYPGCEVVLLDDAGRPVAAGDEGEFAIDKRSQSVFLRYWDEPEATAAKLEDGSPWMRMGDAGTIDDAGYLWFRERRDDVINSAGYRIGPSEIEACLRRHPAVDDAAVVGLPDPERGSIVAAFVQLHGADARDLGELKRELTASVATELAPFQRPRLIEIVDELPRTTTGKVRRAAVRAAHLTEGATP